MQTQSDEIYSYVSSKISFEILRIIAVARGLELTGKENTNKILSKIQR